MSKKSQDLAIHDKDTGSSEIQIALLTEKIENLSKHIKQFKKDKHSSTGLLKAVNTLKEYSFLIRKILSQKVVMKFLPKLLFRKDESFEYAEKIENLIKQANK